MPGPNSTILDGTITNSSGTITGSPVNLFEGSPNTPTVTATGTFTVLMGSSSLIGTATSGGILVTGSPKALPAGSTTITTTGTPPGTINITVTGSGWLKSSPATPTLTTIAASGITKTSVTLNGNLTNLGGYSTVYTYFWYSSDPTFTTYSSTAPKTTMTGLGSFSASVIGLTPETVYYYYAVANNGSADLSVGSPLYFTTGGAPTVLTLSAAAISQTGATLQGQLTSLGNYTSVNVYFEYGTSISYGTSTAAQTLTASGIFQSAITGLNNNVTYHFRADASAGSIVLNGNDVTFVAGQGNWTKVVSGNSNTAYWNMVGSTPTAPTHLYTELGTGFLFGGFLQMISNDSGIPLAMIVFPYAFYISLLLGLVAYVLSMGRAGKDTAGRRPYRGSLPLMAIVSGLSMTYFIIAGGGVIPGWSLIPYGFWAVASIIFRQNQEGRGW